MEFKKAVLGLLVLGLAGCATGGIKRGHVVMKMSEDEAHVALGAGEVQVGDHVELYHHQCAPIGAIKTGIRECKKVEAGHGNVTQVLNPDYSIVKFPQGTKFAEGDTVEKHQH